MKNFFKFAFAVVFALSMTACDGETQTEGPDISNDSQQNIQQDADLPDEPETQEDTSEEDISFDPYWYGDGIARAYPEPPFPVDCPRVANVFESTSPLPENAMDMVMEYCEFLQKIGYDQIIEDGLTEADEDGFQGYWFEAMNSEYILITVVYDGDEFMVYTNNMKSFYEN